MYIVSHEYNNNFLYKLSIILITKKMEKVEKEIGDKMRVCLKTSSKRICKFAVAE